jgi:hypothetical protein
MLNEEREKKEEGVQENYFLGWRAAEEGYAKLELS